MGYPSFKSFLGPYRNARYHLQHFRLTPNFISNDVIFIFHHSSLRNVIKRTFGVCKARWRILQHITSFKLETQISIIWPCFAFHNYVKRIYLGDLDILENLENVEVLWARKQNFNGRDHNDIPHHKEWQEPSQAYVRYMEEVRNVIRDQLPRWVWH